MKSANVIEPIYHRVEQIEWIEAWLNLSAVIQFEMSEAEMPQLLAINGVAEKQVVFSSSFSIHSDADNVVFQVSRRWCWTKKKNANENLLIRED